MVISRPSERYASPLDTLDAGIERRAPACLPSTPVDNGMERDDQEETRGDQTHAAINDVETALPPLDWVAILGTRSGAGRDDNLIKVIADSLRADTGSLPALVVTADVVALRQWIHRMDGTASFLHYAPLADAIGEFRLAVIGENGVTVPEAASILTGRLHRITEHLADQ